MIGRIRQHTAPLYSVALIYIGLMKRSPTYVVRGAHMLCLTSSNSINKNMFKNTEESVNPTCSIRQTEKYILLTFNEQMHAISSCVLNGGLQNIRHVLNLKVVDDDTITEDPAVTLSTMCVELGLVEKCLGMMTAASMTTLRHQTCWFGELYFSAIVTAGLENSRRAGDAADVICSDGALPAGTINLVVSTNANLAPAAMVEALMIATEAKAAALEALNIRSAKSGAIATGTGTDAIAIVSDPNGVPLRYVGKHVVAGEMLAQAVIGALSASLENKHKRHI